MTRLDWIEAAFNWLDEARPISYQYFRAPLAVRAKSDQSPVTQADLAIEQLLRRRIRETFPEHGIVGEEEAPENSDAETRWVIDPIDGTRSFLSGSPLFGTLLALTQGDAVEFGILDLPMLHERWWSCRGEGAFHNGRTCQASRVTELSEASLGCTSPEIFLPQQRPLFEQLTSMVQLTRFGGDCFNYGALAAGWLDLVAEATLKFYDVAPLIVLIEESGGIITGWDGQAITPHWDGTVLAAATPALHAQALLLLQKL
jgi:myo-inositol-1(or 4)-monophosphatase